MNWVQFLREIGIRVDEDAAPALIKRMSIDAATLRAELTARGLRWDDPGDSQRPDGAELAKSAKHVIDASVRSSGLLGAASGVVGLAGVPPEAMARLIQSFRLAQRIAIIYGTTRPRTADESMCEEPSRPLGASSFRSKRLKTSSSHNSHASWMPERWRCTTVQPGSPRPSPSLRRAPSAAAHRAGFRAWAPGWVFSTVASWLECKARKCTMLSGGAGRAPDRNTSRMPSRSPHEGAGRLSRSHVISRTLQRLVDLAAPYRR